MCINCSTPFENAESLAKCISISRALKFLATKERHQYPRQAQFTAHIKKLEQQVRAWAYIAEAYAILSQKELSREM